MSLSNFVNSHGVDGLKQLVIKIVELGDPEFDHKRTENKIGLSDPNSCPRKRQWEIQFGDLIKFEGSLSLLVGTGSHMVIQDRFSKHFAGMLNKTLYIEKPIEIDLGDGCVARSWMDLFFEDKNPQDSIVLDIKTTSKTEENYKTNTLPSNVAQINTYLGVVGAKRGYLIVLYLNKIHEPLDQSIEIIEVEFDKKLYDEVISTLKSIFKAIKNNTVCKAKFDRSDCSYCGFKLVCDEFWDFLTTKIKNPYVRKDYDIDTQYIMNQIVYTNGFATKIDGKTVSYVLNFENIKAARNKLLKKMEERQNGQK